MWTRVLLVILAFSFIAVVFAYGTGQKYSPWAHMEKIINKIDYAPSLESVAEYWTADSWYEEVVTFHDPIQGEHASSPGGFGVKWELVTPEKVTDGNWGVFEPVQSFFGVLKGFFVRSYFTIKWVADVILFAFDMVTVIAPWNGYVKEV